MKKISNLILLLSLIVNAGYAQMGMKGAEIPNYLFADNAPFIAIFYTPIDMLEVKKTRAPGSSGSGITRVTVEEFDPAGVESHDEKLMMEIFKLCNQQFVALKLNPAGYLTLTQADLLSNPDKVKQALGKSMNENKPQYMFTITLPQNLEKAKKALLKDKFSLDLVGPVAISISKIGASVFVEGRIQMPYGINKMNMSLADGFKQFKKDIESKPADYFIKSLDNDDLVDVTISEEEMKKAANQWTAGESLSSWPSDLLNTTLVVYDGEKLSFAHKGKDVTQTFTYKKLAKEYPGTFITTGFTDLTEYSKGPENKYAMLMQATKMVKRTSTYTDGGGMTTETKKKVEAYSFFYLKDLNTQQNYYTSLGKEHLEEHAEIRLISLKYFMQIMKEHYKWE